MGFFILRVFGGFSDGQKANLRRIGTKGWLQHIKNDTKYNLFHIDRHYDSLDTGIDEWIDKM